MDTRTHNATPSHATAHTQRVTNLVVHILCVLREPELALLLRAHISVPDMAWSIAKKPQFSGLPLRAKPPSKLLDAGAAHAG